jgi:hypothetical protein
LQWPGALRPIEALHGGHGGDGVGVVELHAQRSPAVAPPAGPHAELEAATVQRLLLGSQGQAELAVPAAPVAAAAATAAVA